MDNKTTCHTIVDDIDKAIDIFIVKYSQDPKRLYLGRNEWTKLKVFANKIMSYNYEQNTGPEYKGLKIFIVSENDHLFVT